MKIPSNRQKSGIGAFQVGKETGILPLVFKCLSAVPLLVIMALRDGVGTDYSSYASDYKIIQHGGTTHTDAGFQALSHVVAFFGFSHLVLFGICSVILISGVYALAGIVENQLAMVVFLFLASFNYFISFSLISQYTAIGVLCWAFTCLFRERYFFATVALLVAGSLHSSSFIFVPVFVIFVLLKKIPKYGRLITGVVLFASVVGSSLLGILVPTLLKGTRFGGYLTDHKYSSLKSGSLIVICIAIAFFMVLVRLLVEKSSQDATFQLLLIVQFVAMSLSLAQSQITLLFRMIYYFAFFAIIAIPYTMQFIRSRGMKTVVRCGVIISYLVWVVLFPFSNNDYDVLPYHFIGL